ncbi:MAG: methyltransferase domain-containing protein [Burkholderiales bacterium]|nr:methyltransferase domain-containing protein [Burkholderiales bacterium]
MLGQLSRLWRKATVVSPPPLTAVSAQPAASRRDRLLALFDSTGLGLEVGASFNPLLPKKDGYNIEILDHLSAEDLVGKYQGATGADVSRIEPVDYVSSGGSLFDAIGKPGRFDYIVASHVIEHTVDLLGFLQDCERLLTPTGVLVLAVPDKRYSFDVMRPLTSTGDVLQANLDKRTRHSLGALFDEVAYNSLRSGAPGWAPGSDGPLTFVCDLSRAKQIFEETQGNQHFHDIHAWQFSPSSFRLIVNDLHEIGYLGLREQRFDDDCGGEFFITLSRQGTGPSASRLELAQRALAETALISTRVSSG